MTARVLASLVLAAKLGATPILGQGQIPTTAFRADVYVVAIEIQVFKGKIWCDGSQPDGGLTAKDFVLTLDKKAVPAKVEASGKPGGYFLSFSPPDKVRDGKRHDIRLAIQKRGSVSWKIAMPRASIGVDSQGPIDLTEPCTDLH